MIRNSGAINAKVGGDDAVARAIVDLSGHVAMVENSGAISATGAKDAADNIAIDLSANNGGATVKQTAVASGATAPSITGNVRFGGGNDVLELADGKMTGTTSFGGGDNQHNLTGGHTQARNRR